MKNLYILPLVGAFMFSASAANAESSHADCDAHAAHIDHEVGATKALEAFDVLHGDHGDTKHVVENMKKEHPAIEHELEEFVKSGCKRADLEAHAEDAETPDHH